LKIVTDATVLIRAHKRSRGLARRLLHENLERGHRLVLSNEMIAAAAKVLRYPRFKDLDSLTEADLLEYTQYLQNAADIVVLDPQYSAPVLQMAERGEADVLCTHDGDFYDKDLLSFCLSRGIEVCTEATLLPRLIRQ